MSATNPSGSGSMSFMDAVTALESQETPEAEKFEEERAELEEGESQNQEQESEDESQDESEEEGESEEAEETEESEEEPQTLKVKVDGEEIEVTLDELKSGYSRHKDYTKKSQALAEQRKAFEAEAREVLAERQQYKQLIGALQQKLNVNTEPDWETLRNTDPVEYSIQMADWNRMQLQKSAIEQEQRRLAQIEEFEQQKQANQLLQQQAKFLEDKLPDWKDPEKRKTVQAKIKEQGAKLGISEEELSQIYDHRAVVSLYKAALYDELMSKRQNLKPVAPNSKTVAPKAKVPVGNVALKRAHEAFKQTKSIASAANLLNFLEK